MQLKDLVKVMDKDQKVVITKGVRHIFNDRLYNLELSGIENIILNYYVHNVWYNSLYKSIFINVDDYRL